MAVTNNTLNTFLIPIPISWYRATPFIWSGFFYCPFRKTLKGDIVRPALTDNPIGVEHRHQNVRRIYIWHLVEMN